MLLVDPMAEQASTFALKEETKVTLAACSWENPSSFESTVVRQSATTIYVDLANNTIYLTASAHNSLINW